MKKIVIVLMITSLMGCGVVYFNPRNMNSLHLGMTRTEVITILGRPNIADAEKWGESLEYIYHGDQYFVRLKDGKVESYGTVD
jgi:outer membrane protein assembly factor BamE (lipoprotein component of BamABCDE complex)